MALVCMGHLVSLLARSGPTCMVTYLCQCGHSLTWLPPTVPVTCTAVLWPMASQAPCSPFHRFASHLSPDGRHWSSAVPPSPVVPNIRKGRTNRVAPTGHKWATKLGFRRSNTELFTSDLCVQRRELTLPARRPTDPHIASNTFHFCSILRVRFRLSCICPGVLRKQVPWDP